MFFLRFLKALGYAEKFTVNNNTYLGYFRLLDTSTMNTYLDSVAVMGVVKPGLELFTRGDAVINVNDTITRDERTYTVLKISQHKLMGKTIIKTVVLS